MIRRVLRIGARVMALVLLACVLFGFGVSYQALKQGADEGDKVCGPSDVVVSYLIDELDVDNTIIAYGVEDKPNIVVMFNETSEVWVSLAVDVDQREACVLGSGWGVAVHNRPNV